MINFDNRETCGCGREVRYMTSSGNACNKYKRCNEPNKEHHADFQEDLKIIHDAAKTAFNTVYSNASYKERMQILKGEKD